MNFDLHDINDDLSSLFSLNDHEINNLKSAKHFAETVHSSNNQTYDDKPYTFHLSSVYKIAWEYLDLVENVDGSSPRNYSTKFKPKAILKATWLHDTIEDGSVDYHDVEHDFGTDVADIVWGVTDESGKTKKDSILKTFLKMRLDPNAIFVKMCDRMANMRYSVDNGSDSYLDRYRKEYPVFRYFLRIPELESMWKDLDDLHRKGNN